MFRKGKDNARTLGSTIPGGSHGVEKLGLAKEAGAIRECVGGYRKSLDLTLKQMGSNY